MGATGPACFKAPSSLQQRTHRTLDEAGAALDQPAAAARGAAPLDQLR